jgi:hypothetical protein
MVCHTANNTWSLIEYKDDDPAVLNVVQHASEKKVARRVHFGANEYFEKSQPTEEDVVPHSSLWYTSGEYQQFKKDHKQDAKKVAQDAKSPENQAVLRLFILSKSQEPHLLDTDTIANLKKFRSKASNNGLVKFSTRELFGDKSVRRRAIWNVFDSSDTIQMINEEALASACQKHSDTSVLFSQIFGLV